MIYFAFCSLIRTFAHMFGRKGKDHDLLAYIREGRTMTQSEKLSLIVSLSIPSILAQISATVMFFIDASMVGHIGARASAAIGLVETTGWLMGGLSMAANMGFSVQVAHFIGANDFEKARHVLRQSIVCCFIWALAFSLTALAIGPFLPYWLGGTEEIAHDASIYFMLIGVFGIFFQMEGLAGSMLKCSGNMKVPSLLNILMCVMDVAFNYLFIYILDLGVIGAALGTGLAELITAALMFYFLLWRSILKIEVRGARYEVREMKCEVRGTRCEVREMKCEVRGTRCEVRGTRCEVREMRGENTPEEDNEGVQGNLAPRTSNLAPRYNTWRAFRPTADIVGKAFKIGGPMGLQHMLMGGAQIVSTLIVAPLGTIAIASHSLAITVESLCYMPGYGIAEAATTLVGQSFGAGQRLLVRSFARMSVSLGVGVMTLMGVLMYVFAPELMSLMTPVEAIRELGSDVLRIEAFAEPMFAAAIVCNGVFIGAGDTLKPAIMSLASMWGIRLTLAAFLARDYGLTGVWMAMAIELTCRGVMFLVRMSRGARCEVRGARCEVKNEE